VLAVEGERALKEAGAGGAVLGGEQLGIGQPRVVVDRDVQVLPAGLRERWTPSARIRLPTVQKQPSFFVSTWTSSPGRSRS
jgi:hypothetical protein